MKPARLIQPANVLETHLSRAANLSCAILFWLTLNGSVLKAQQFAYVTNDDSPVQFVNTATNAVAGPFQVTQLGVNRSLKVT